MVSAKILGDSIVNTPKAYEAQAAEQIRDAFGARFEKLNSEEQALIRGVAGCSPYLRRLMLRDPDFTVETLRKKPAAVLGAACRLARLAGQAADETDQLSRLRRAKDQAALVIALADIAGVWDAMTAARAISIFADACVRAALMAAPLRAGFDPRTPGLTVIAMGKHGAEELNYSSDIDFVVLFDAEKMGETEYAPAQKRAITITRAMVNLLHTQTQDGYVFRTDLRLRPDPGVTAVALSITAAETYYEAYGQNWERMAYIKARAIAGDMSLGKEFIQVMRPFVWRKYLDFAAIDDVKAVKRQIHSAKGGLTIEFSEHDLKLGRGGIREIEFYVQTQQLILGGKDPSLRRRGTLNALISLREAGHISAENCQELSEAYCYLRLVEHRLQMINDEQTHSIPKLANDIERLSCLLCAASVDAFKEKLLGTLQLVAAHFDSLFKDGASPTDISGPLVFTGVANDPATMETLRELGFQRVDDVCETIRSWHAGGMRATRTARGRELLTKLMAPMIEALSKASNPDDAFFAFDSFLKRLPAGVQMFSLLVSNIALFEDLIKIMTLSPYLGRELAKRVNFIERLINNSWKAVPKVSSYGPSLSKALVECRDYEAVLNGVRRWAGEKKFMITAQLVVGVLAPTEAAVRFTAIADACIKALFPAALKEIHGQHGAIEGELTVVGLGRLGAGEMTSTSDIDLIFIYEAAKDAVSNGARPLTPTEYFTRLVRRIVTALSAATEEGALYDVDMQLRPSGGAGPTAVSLLAFNRYYEQDAWTWEFMALTKARIIVRSAKLGKKVEQEIDRLLRQPRDAETVASDVHDMRQRLLKAKPGAGLWDVKNQLGGLTDIAFICQYLALIAGNKLGPPPRATMDALQWLADAGVLKRDDAMSLGHAHAMFDAILQVERGSTGGAFDPETDGEALGARMAAICGAETIEQAEQILTARQSIVVKIYHKILDQQADNRNRSMV
ncbi:MAG: bifunctional [glutamine synthetase] adenylyltransferase/[glutamine synthetase]-adenylyl-L-tyrosine phosphorylase [Alphaproteobacteria bacterium]|nr:bifunctional [glutamine synthetase] adenylyltransferase/[glutamine synthetase]-adenylyl-L-tyrosine phosphorylase [Alphaproteobacteria bacterium]